MLTPITVIALRQLTGVSMVRVKSLQSNFQGFELWGAYLRFGLRDDAEFLQKGLAS